MTKQKWLIALLVASSIGCFCGDSPTTAQSLSSIRYRLQVLPNAGGLSNPLSINNRDWVSGVAGKSEDIFDIAALWRRSQTGNQSWQFTNLGTLGGPQAAIESPNKNEIGWLAGVSDTATTDPYAENFCGWHCSVPTGCNQVCRGFLWREETRKMIELPPITPIPRCSSQHNAGCNSHASASNNNHQVAGYAENGVMDQTCVAPQVFLYQGVVWSLDASGKPFIQRKLPPVDGDAVSYANGMSDAGMVVGGSGGCAAANSAVFPLRAVLWKEGSNPRDLGTLGGTEALGYAINEIGQVVGLSTLPPPNDAVIHAFIWQEGRGMKDLYGLHPDTDTGVFPQSINNRGEVVGWSCGPDEPTPNPNFPCNGFYWRNGVMVDLNKHLTQPTTLQICCANDINDNGEITAAAYDPTFNKGDYVPVVLVPQQDVQSTAETLPVQSVEAVQRSVLPSDILQRLNPRLRGWKNAR